MRNCVSWIKFIYEGIMCLFLFSVWLTQWERILRHFSVDILISCECSLSAFSFSMYVNINYTSFFMFLSEDEKGIRNMTLRQEKWRKCCKFAAMVKKDKFIIKNVALVLKTFCFVCMPREQAFVHFLNKKLLQCAVNFSIVIYSPLSRVHSRVWVCGNLREIELSCNFI